MDNYKQRYGKNYRTNEFNKVLDLIFQETNKLEGCKKEKFPENSENFSSVPGAGAEASVAIVSCQFLFKVLTNRMLGSDSVG